RARAAFNMPQVMMQPPTLRQALIDASQLLTTGRITPQQFGERLEAAAAADRLHAAHPDLVEMNHPLAGGALLAGIAAIAAWALWRRWRGRSLPRPAEPDAYFGRMRAPVALGFVGPAFLLYGALVLLPGAAAFGWALTRWNGLGPRAWAGLFNFKWLLFESDVFWLALKNNLYLVVVPALAVVPLSLLLAALIHRGVWGRNAFRAILLFPNLLGGIAATLLWMNAYEPHGGLVNAGLAGLGRALGSRWLQSFADYPWLAPEHLYTALIPIYLWLACGFNLVLYLAAMEGIDPQLYEAAALDGVPVWRQFFTLTLPLIREMVAISIVFLVIGGLNAFEMIWLLTSQDPATPVNTLATLLVSTMFKDFAIGRAAAIAVVMFALVFAASAAVMRFFRPEAVE
ncbi:MAG TPA: sugar ABC transporter permease, partial [Opitutaceae bacterium]|nr:sugar ABC transporter permease [Opitutaceae bacterium]